MSERDSKLKVVVVGAGHMGASHARAYRQLNGFELAAIVAPSSSRRTPLAKELGNIAEFAALDDALKNIDADVVSINSYPDTHYSYAMQSLEHGAHLFMEKPIAETVEQAREIVALANKKNLKVVVGYILRQHPAWMEFINIARTLGKPLVMRMNLNQQSSGTQWETHKQLMKSMSPIVDCGVHYVDVMCQMTRSEPLQVQAIGARLSDEIADDMYNYGNLQVRFADGSIGWYEAGWGPMMSETAFFVKDVIGPKGCVSIVDPNKLAKTDSSEIDGHTKTNSLLVHKAERTADGTFTKPDQIIDTHDEPDHQGLCTREQIFLYETIMNNRDLTDHLNDAINSLRIVLAADESVRTGKIITLS
ncbi:MAG: Gfo/Idh/MocA family oxidoreductase [Calditrichaeota bacterium]|nr:Gfo/Idh/MocA family oxidoreductase [Calditrichota bacterium]